MPYHAIQAIDEALMESAAALRALLPVISGKSTTPEEKMQRLAEAVHHIHENARALRSIRKQENE